MAQNLQEQAIGPSGPLETNSAVFSRASGSSTALATIRRDYGTRSWRETEREPLMLAHANYRRKVGGFQAQIWSREPQIRQSVSILLGGYVLELKQLVPSHKTKPIIIELKQRDCVEASGNCNGETLWGGVSRALCTMRLTPVSGQPGFDPVTGFRVGIN
ncbi:hypothetical protein C8R44DRAFT_738013 [Mycena epipterygia]|nr:hypothetical protein C8R44DRAFT_738013 [Mycena epipterygia]